MSADAMGSLQDFDADLATGDPIRVGDQPSRIGEIGGQQSPEFTVRFIRPGNSLSLI